MRLCLFMNVNFNFPVFAILLSYEFNLNFRYLFLGPAAGGHLVHDCTKKSTTPPSSTSSHQQQQQRASPQDFLGNEDTPENNASFVLQLLFSILNHVVHTPKSVLV